MCRVPTYLKCTYIFQLLLNRWICFDETVCVCLSRSMDSLGSQLHPVGPIQRGTQAEISRFKVNIFIYKLFLLVTRKIN